MTRPIVLIESPFRDGDRQRNLRYLQWCMADSASRGECPVASHAIGPLFWPEDDKHRTLGKELHAALQSIAEVIVAYVDLGESAGMGWSLGFERCRCLRQHNPAAWAAFERGEPPQGTVELVAR